MRKLIIRLFILSCNLRFGQIKSVILSSETKEKVPFVNIWIEKTWEQIE